MISFSVHWPRDATRILPLPAASAVTLRAEQSFTAVLGAEVLQSSGSPHTATLQLKEVAAPIQQTLAWYDAQQQLLGQTELLLLPDAAKVLVPAEVPLPVGESHGVLANLTGAAVQARAAWGTVMSKYDAFLSANLDSAGPGDRRVLLPWVDLLLHLGSETLRVGAEHVQSFQSDRQSLRWRLFIRGLSFSATLHLGTGNAISLQLECHSVVTGQTRISVVPQLEDRSFHHVTQAFTGAEQEFPHRIQPKERGFSFAIQGGHTLYVSGSAPYTNQAQWRYCVPLPFCAGRGLEPHTDVFSPGAFLWQPAEAGRFLLTASVNDAVAPEAPPPIPPREPMPLPRHLQQAMQLFLAQRSGELTVIAGFPWFLDWGRDSLIFTRGLIATGQLREAASILRRFATYEQDGTLPNLLRGSEVTNRETSDAPLWLVVAIGDLADAKGDLDGDCGGRTLLQVARDILAAKQRTIMDRTSGLLHSSAHHSWMDTDNPACTPREGYPIEIQALWCRALRVVAELAKDEAASVLAEQVAHSIEHLYWREADSYYADCLHAPAGTPAALAVKDDHLRPNQWLGVSLQVLTQPERLQRMLTTSQCLLVPGAARSLAPQPVAVPVNRHSWLDVTHPYQSHYTGAEDSHRKPAYHNGTAWCWQYPLYAEAVAIADGSEGKAVARRLLSASAPLLSHGCIGQLPEIVDGDLPHSSRGCGAQAWSVSEWLRVWQEL